MAGPATYGGLGLRGGGLGLMGLGAGQQSQPLVLPAMPATALPYIAHLYTNGMQFKRSLGGARLVGSQSAGALITKPGLKMTINGGYQPITLDLDAEQPPPNLVIDPGFEASDFLTDVQLNWTLSTPGEWIFQASDPTSIHGGRRAVKCLRTNTGPNNWNECASQVAFPIRPGQVYTVSGWSKQNAGTRQSHFKLDFADASGGYFASIAPMAGTDGVKPWTFYTASGVAPANAVMGKFRLEAGWWDGVTGTDAQTWFDDLRAVLGTDASDPILNGDIIQLTEQGDNAGTVLYTGIVETLVDDIDGDDGTSVHQVQLTPLVAELADAYFNQQYTVLTDVAQMVRDAVRQTAHCRVAPYSVGDSGVTAIYNFNATNALDVLNVAKQIAGQNWFWFVDATGLVWFQSAPTTNPPEITLKRGVDYNRVRRSRSIIGRKNHAELLGGYAPLSTTPLHSVYDSPSSRKLFGLRNFDPPLIFSTVTDQATLNKLAATIGAAFDREVTIMLIALPGFAKRLSLANPGGLTVRLSEPDKDPYPQPGTRGSPGYSGPWVCQDIEVDGVKQTLLLSDLPLAGLSDIQYLLDRIVQRSTTAGSIQPPLVANSSQ